MSKLTDSIETLSGVGEAYQKRLRKLGLHRLFDVVCYTPRTYESRASVKKIAYLHPGESARIHACIVSTEVVFRKRKMLNVVVADDSAILTLRFFHFYPSQLKQFAVGREISCFGSVRQVGRVLEMGHPEYSFELEEEAGPQVLPLYPLSEGLSQKRIRSYVESALIQLNHDPELELLPHALCEKEGLISFKDAITLLHQTDSIDAKKRLSFEELLAHRLAIKKSQVNPGNNAPLLSMDREGWNALIKSLPFVPTDDQLKAFQEIAADMGKTRPMHRLLQGDVGSGKTLVALMSAWLALSQGYQVAFMAPTEILATQLFQKAQELLTPFGFQVDLLTGGQTKKNKTALSAALSTGQAELVIGTHALIQDGVQFKNLGLVIIDEQHRFGVAQRLRLNQNGTHQLIMTATPIPRTLAMTLYSELHISSIHELPQGRKPIKTALIAEERRSDIIQRLKQSCEQGKQAYWICPLIEESDHVEAEAAEVTFKRLSKELPHLAIGLLHGRMKSSEKEAVMAAFKAGTLSILVATTVVEVGVDVPNASIIIIENPERMGLSQLHQLRGRVGRGAVESFCVLLYQAPLSPISYERLLALRDRQDGFYLADKDLELRGPGEFLGTRQTGVFNFRFASFMRDQLLLPTITHAAEWMLKHASTEATLLIDRWFGQGIEFLTV